jgi:hypothetical protein
MKYDHFHAEIFLSNGTIEEVEGGWTGYPNEWDDMDFIRQEFVLIHIVAGWWIDRSDGVSIVKLGRFRLAG